MFPSIHPVISITMLSTGFIAASVFLFFGDGSSLEARDGEEEDTSCLHLSSMMSLHAWTLTKKPCGPSRGMGGVEVVARFHCSGPGVLAPTDNLAGAEL